MNVPGISRSSSALNEKQDLVCIKFSTLIKQHVQQLYTVELCWKCVPVYLYVYVCVCIHICTAYREESNGKEDKGIKQRGK